ncbi:MAG: hypothetical protein IT348_20105 [Candidatus Eisenbacteria bacterium]|nr:hypothetical protein [Candidatus Eisenbacteria bacterium]
MSGDTGPWITSLAMSDHHLYVAGYFDHAGRPCGSWTSFDLASGTPMPGGARVAGEVSASVSDGAGGWFLGGAITGVDGVERTGLAHLLADGSASSWAPVVNGKVNTLLLRGDTLLVGGSFGSINGVLRANLAAVSATTGAVLPWGSGANGRVEDLLLVADTLFVGGAFRTIHGVERSSLAALDVDDGAVLDWGFTFIGSPFAIGTPFVTRMALDGSRLYVGGDFNTINGLATGSFAAIERATATVIPGSFPVGYGTTGIVVHGGRVYVSGPFAHYTSAGVAHGLVALSRSTLQIVPWAAEQPRYRRGGGAFAADGDRLFVGEDWKDYYYPIDALCAVDTATGALRPFADSLRSAGRLQSMQIAGGRLWVGGPLHGVKWVRRRGVAEISLGSGQLTDRELVPPQGEIATRVAVAGRYVVMANYFQEMFGFDPELSTEPLWVKSFPLVQYMLGVQGRLFVLGTFPVAGGPATRHGVAEIDPATGNVLPWSPVFADMGGQVIPVALAADSARLYVGGGFLTVDGVAHEGLVAFRLSDLAMEPTTYATMAYVVALASTGDRLFVLGDRVGWPLPSLFAMDPVDGAALPWSPLAGTSAHMVSYPENAIVVANGELLVANELTVDSGPFAGQHPLFRASLTASSWSPYPHAPVGPVNALAAREGSLAVVGGITAFGPHAASGLAIVSWPTAGVPPATAPLGRDLAVWPAPVRDRLTLRYAAASGQRATVRIVDVAGRLEHEFELPAGSGEAAWDLRRENGAQIAPGVHFALVMQSGRKRAWTRFVVVR